MHVGFVLHWQRGDAAQLAIRLAGRLQACGYDVEFFSRDKPQPVDPAWDRHVVKPDDGYAAWLARLHPAHVVFGEPPAVADIGLAKGSGARTYLLCLWCDLAEDNLVSLRWLDRVVCPARNAHRLLVRLGLKNSLYLPWDPGAPITADNRAVDPWRVGAYWPAAAGGSLRQSPEVAKAVWQAVAAYPAGYLTVAYSASSSPPLVRELRRLAAGAGGRIELVKDPSADREQLLFGRHDVTLWPTLSEGAGLAGLTSVYMGTPVVAFDHPVVAETVRDGRNGILVPCGLSYNSLDVPVVEPDYPAFSAAASALIGNPPALDDLRQGLSAGLTSRRENFLAAVDELFL